MNLNQYINHLKKIDKDKILIGVAIVGIVITAGLIYYNKNGGFSMPNIFGESANQVGTKAVEYINGNNLAASEATLVNAVEESGVIKIKIKIGTQEFDSYVTKDGKYLFPQAFNIAPKDDAKGATTSSKKSAGKPNTTTVQKSDSPMLEAYVVARCPYGLQMQRAMAEAVKEQPSLAQYIKARYIGAVSGNTITAMHGEAEAKENLRQICIREEQPAKYWSYVGCQMQSSGTEVSCEKSTGVDSAKLSACTTDPSRGVAYAKEDFDLANQKNVSGSPTLILNGATVSESNYGGRSADAVRAMVCAGSNKEGSFCSAKLNTAAAAVSFSKTYSSGSGASGNSGATGAGCQAAQ